MPAKSQPPEVCPVCGAEIPARAKACPQCGADERTGWNEEATRYDGLDLPDHAFEEESPKRGLRREHIGPTGIPYFTWFVAFVMLVIIATLVLHSIF